MCNGRSCFLATMRTRFPCAPLREPLDEEIRLDKGGGTGLVRRFWEKPVWPMEHHLPRPEFMKMISGLLFFPTIGAPSDSSHWNFGNRDVF